MSKFINFLLTESKHPTWTLKSVYAVNNPDLYIGDPKTAKMLESKGITEFYPCKPDHKVASVGFAPKEQKWYGWSYRAIYGFKIGDKVKKGDCVCSATPDMALQPGFKAKTLDDARKMAEAFAESVG